MAPRKLSASALAHALNVPPNRVTILLREERDVTADTALRLARAFDTMPEFWMNLQVGYDLPKAETESARKIASEVKRVGRASRVPATPDERKLETVTR